MRAVGAATHPARNEGGMVKRSWMSACRRMPYAGCNGSIPHPEVPRRGLEGRGLRAWGRVCRSPPLPAGISPSGGEIGKPHAIHSIRNFRDGRDLSTSRSPHLRGRCPAGQRGVSHTLKPHDAYLKTSPPKILPNQINSLPKIPKKTPKIPPQLSPRRANHPHNCPVPPSDTPQGVAARRDRRWWQGGYASSSSSGSSSNPPGGTGGGRHRFRTGRCHPPDARPGRITGAETDRLGDPRCIRQELGRRVYRQLIVPWSNAIMGIEAKVRRYTGTRCICPALLANSADGSQGAHLAGAGG